MLKELSTQAQSIKKVLVLGDYCIDQEYEIIGEKENPENKEVPLYKCAKASVKPGMADNVVNGLEKLGFMVENAKCHIPYNASFISIKSRFYKQGKYQFRIDEDTNPAYTFDSNVISRIIATLYNDLEAIVVSDYNKGTISSGGIKVLCSIAEEKQIPIFIDTKKQNLQDFQSAIIKINEKEAGDVQPPNKIPKGTIVTLGEKGAIEFGTNIGYRAPKVKVVDVCGAGDAFLCGLVYGTLRGPQPIPGMVYGLVAGSISVAHRGTYNPTLTELEQGISRYLCEKEL